MTNARVPTPAELDDSPRVPALRRWKAEARNRPMNPVVIPPLAVQLRALSRELSDYSPPPFRVTVPKPAEPKANPWPERMAKVLEVLPDCGGIVTVRTIMDRTGLTEALVFTALRKLRAKGKVQTVRGPGGGVRKPIGPVRRLR